MIVVSLFDESGNMVRPWADAGHECYCFDVLNRDETRDGIHFRYADLRNFELPVVPDIVFGFPPCTDLAVSGACRFAGKLAKNPNVFDEAMELVYTVPWYGRDVPWMLENPVSVISTMWRKPDYIFHPYEYGGYLPEDDVHPRWPDYIMPRDAYQKKTCIWAGNGFIMPPKDPVEPIIYNGYATQQQRLGGKSKKTKQIRSETPRGFAQAVYEANAPLPRLWAESDARLWAESDARLAALELEGSASQGTLWSGKP
jgi:hypothetical protein